MKCGVWPVVGTWLRELCGQGDGHVQEEANSAGRDTRAARLQQAEE